ncbi:MAG TPA: hypothetical protein VKW76_04525 [Candidatus Binatia bacterium]|nr:hypothetical protein [Candidatus Binatia bacterium]
MAQEDPSARRRYFWRISLFDRILHGVLMASFLGLAATGLPIKLNWAPWATALAQAMGGLGTILFLHKVSAVALTLCFFTHLVHVGWMALVERRRGLFWGPGSLVPQPKDLVDLYGNVKWFLGLGPKPRFDRFTYWEKFDYWAVFWGMFIIGTSGFVLWFSEFFARFLPGWMFNVALIVHSEEALLAVWFIFTIHFFNAHLRPEKFPMDLVIFTGRVSGEELREERPLEFERLVRSGRLGDLETRPPERWLRNFGRLLGLSVVVTGFVLFTLTILAFS